MKNSAGKGIWSPPIGINEDCPDGEDPTVDPEPTVDTEPSVNPSGITNSLTLLHESNNYK